MRSGRRGRRKGGGREEEGRREGGREGGGRDIIVTIACLSQYQRALKKFKVSEWLCMMHSSLVPNLDTKLLH